MSYDSSSLTMRRMQRMLYAHKMQQMAAMRAGQRSTMQLEGGNRVGAMAYTPNFYYTNTGALETTIEEDAIYSGRTIAPAEPEPEVRESIPSVPTITSITRSDRSATISFTATGSVSTVYTVKALPGPITVSGSSSPLTITGLSAGTVYTFTVSAANSAGSSGDSADSEPITAIAVAGAPTGVTAVGGNGSATVSFTAPASNGGSAITGYTAYSNPPGFTGSIMGATAAPITVSGLTNGTDYTFTVVATNSVGDSVASAASVAVTPKTVPASPTGVSAVAGNASATVSFTAPTNTGGSAITGYTVTSSPGGLIGSITGATTAPITVSGLNNGTAYTFTVVATNAAGNSVASSASSAVTPMTVPSAPASTGASLTVGNGFVTVGFNESISNGGSAITRYTVTSSPDGFTGTGIASPITVLGLSNGTPYIFTIVASNIVGNSTAAGPYGPATPRTVPNAPTGVSAVAGNGLATVSFSAPTNNGGSAIIDYTVTSNPSGFTGTGSGSGIVVSGLSNGTAYTFTVVARNIAGNSAPSSSSILVTPKTVPGAPTSISAVAGNGSATVSFTAPASNGGSAITGYTVTSSPGNITATSSGSPIVISGLTNGTAYTFTVMATNAAGNSLASSASSSVTPKTVPGAPTGVSAVAGNASATVSFTAPASNGGATITGYTVTSSPGGFTGTGSGSPIVVSGLSNGTAYTFTVVATNSAGDSVASAVSVAVTPKTVPAAPTGVSAVAGNGSATVSFTAPASNGGSAITGYKVTSSGGQIATGTGSAILVSGLTNGTAYTFTVVATNSVGDSVASAVSVAVTPKTVPNAPTGATASLNTDGTVTVSFTAPTSNGGSAITDYTVTSSSDGRTATGSSSPLTVSGLTTGSTYTFTVTAANSEGTSVASAASNSVLIASVPDAPTSVVATRGDFSATISFTPPVNDGGSPITGYLISYANTTANTSSTTPTPSSPVTISALGAVNDVCTFTVYAINSIGTSLASNTVSIYVAKLPGAPTSLSLPGTKTNTTINVSFTGSTVNNATTGIGTLLTNYEYTLNNGTTFTALSPADTTSPITITGLTQNTSYTIKLRAVTNIGVSPMSASSVTATTYATSGTPTINSILPGPDVLYVYFTRSATNNSFITNYEYSSDNGVTFTAASPATTLGPIKIPSLANNISYNVKIRATGTQTGASDPTPTVIGTTTTSYTTSPLIHYDPTYFPTYAVTSPVTIQNKGSGGSNYNFILYNTGTSNMPYYTSSYIGAAQFYPFNFSGASSPQIPISNTYGNDIAMTFWINTASFNADTTTINKQIVFAIKTNATTLDDPDTFPTNEGGRRIDYLRYSISSSGANVTLENTTNLISPRIGSNSTNTTIPLNTWTHVGVIITSQIIYFFQNGEAVYISNYSSPSFTSTGIVAIFEAFSGYIGHFKLFTNSGLNTSVISNDYTSTKATYGL